MTTQAEYDAGTAAAMKLMQADIQSEIPQMFRGQITPALVNAHAKAVAKTVLDAAAAVRAKAQQKT